MKKNIKVNTEWMSQLETLTKDGKASKVNELIKGLNFKKVPREFRYLISQICFRNSLYIESLKVLNPIIHPSTPNSPKPKAQELISYANALVSINMNTEARKLLKKVNKEEYPEALLIESFSYFGEWNYEKTIPILRKFIANPKLSYYRQIVGKVNLAAALVTTLKISEAEQLLFELLKITQENKYNLLQGNTLELLAQLEIQKRNYHQSLKYLKQAKEVFIDPTSIYFFFIKKWESICHILLNPTKEKIHNQLLELKHEAGKWKQWETSRDIDLYISYATKNTTLLQKVFFGTINNNFYQKIDMLYGSKISYSNQYHLKMSEDLNPSKTIAYSDIMDRLKSNHHQQKLFKVLISDFYRPSSLGYIFSQLYPNEYFNPVTSEKRVLNQFYALSKSLNSQFPYFELKKDKLEFSIKLSDDVKIEFNRAGHRKHFYRTQKEELRSFIIKPFTSKDLAIHLNCSKRKAQMIIQKLIKEQLLKTLSSGPQIKYIKSRNTIS